MVSIAVYDGANGNERQYISLDDCCAQRGFYSILTAVLLCVSPRWPRTSTCCTTCSASKVSAWLIPCRSMRRSPDKSKFDPYSEIPEGKGLWPNFRAIL